MGKKIRTEEVDHLFEAILCLKDKEECYTFFEDVCTINELLSLSQRFEVAKMLTDKRTYLDISEAENPGFTASLLFSYEGVSGDLDSEVIYWYMSAEIFFVFSLASEEFFILLDKTQNT